MKKLEAAKFSQVFGQRSTLTVGEVADYLRVHRSTIYRLLRAHQIKGYKVGGLWRFNPTDLDNLWTQMSPDKTLHTRRK
jgi:excisionase family DNA binding protein